MDYKKKLPKNYGDKIIEYTFNYLGCKYIFGGYTLDLNTLDNTKVDCSGLIYQALKDNNLTLRKKKTDTIHLIDKNLMEKAKYQSDTLIVKKPIIFEYINKEELLDNIKLSNGDIIVLRNEDKKCGHVVFYTGKYKNKIHTAINALSSKDGVTFRVGNKIQDFWGTEATKCAIIRLNCEQSSNKFKLKYYLKKFIPFNQNEFNKKVTYKKYIDYKYKEFKKKHKS